MFNTVAITSHLLDVLPHCSQAPDYRRVGALAALAHLLRSDAGVALVFFAGDCVRKNG